MHSERCEILTDLFATDLVAKQCSLHSLTSWMKICYFSAALKGDLFCFSLICQVYAVIMLGVCIERGQSFTHKGKWM